ncbi:presenilin family intramembrane aspartyl protease PSH [Halodesulfurarchaeum sp. HSR-GB]|uniref:presenilin family intramembrane aspartyl protease PSH n=1 Tax=Halodesulfurarchaeum sp. HSR-GB TaxID=3074077 RepID=UPI002859F250|nr:presenilin family intramembrane aspartyl protease PSH [Halodesulfurarchaeum sp. HSR-GB]MDR5657142.1 presenilin family intramembrane aspartyl protease PSH [Halodesulfurarchaeum sp. HSR-GB]
MHSRGRIAIVILGAVGFFLAVQLGALFLQGPFSAAGFQAVEDPSDPANAAFYVGVLLVATVGMLALLKYDLTALLRAFVVLTSGLISAYVFSVVLPPIIDFPGLFHLGAVIGAAAVIVGLAVYPEWWVIDASGLVMGMGAAALFGISLDILPVLLLLTVLAVYDAISVYGTEHMLTLATGVMELRVPVLIVLPTTRSFSFREMVAEMKAETDPETEESADPFERDAFFIGLGDVVIPTILVVSGTVFLETPLLFGLEVAALGAMVGTLLGLLGLLAMVVKGRPHAGLPLLNGGAITGYLVGALAGGVPIVEALGLAPYL